MKALWNFLCFMVPHFITDYVALEKVAPGDDWGSYEIVCAMEDIDEDEEFDAVASVDSFVWMGFGLTYRLGAIRPWPR